MPLTLMISCFLLSATNLFSIKYHLHFTIGSTHQVTSNKLQHIRKSENHSRNFFFYRLPHLWNTLISYALLQSNINFTIILMTTLSKILYQIIRVTTLFNAHAVGVTNHQLCHILITYSLTNSIVNLFNIILN